MLRNNKITVLMPVYNSQEYLCEAIESILNQTYENFEFLIINDGSTDNSHNILEEYQKKDSRIRVIHQENAGISAALNKGLLEAKTELIARMDGDDISLPSRLEKQIDFLDQNPYIVLVGSSIQIIDENNKFKEIVKFPTMAEDIKNKLLTRSVIAHPTALFRRKPIMDVGGYRHNLKIAQDYDLWLRLAEKWPLGNLDEELLLYRVHSDNTSSNIQKRNIDHLIAIEAYLSRQFEGKDPIENIEVLNDYDSVKTILENSCNPLRVNRLRSGVELSFLSTDRLEIELLKSLFIMYKNRWIKEYICIYLSILGELTKLFKKAYRDKKYTQFIMIFLYFLVFHPFRFIFKSKRWKIV